MVNIGIIGLGHWGPNYLRIFSQLEEARVVGCSDLNEKALGAYKNQYPGLKTFTDYRELLKLKEIDAVILATPTTTHYTLAKEAIKAGKNLLVEKPLTTKTSEARELTEAAREAKLILMTGHTFLFNAGINRVKEYIDSKELGDIYYLHAARTNLGPIRQDVNALVDLATHDISILLYLLGKVPDAVSAQGSAYLQKDREDVAFIVLYFPGNILCHIHVSWLEPRKVRLMTVIGDKKMLVFDDINLLEPIRIYDKGVISSKTYRDFGEFQMILREGDVRIPKINLSEPLKNQCRHFLDMIGSGRQPESEGDFAVNVVRVLEAAGNSLKGKGKTEKL